MPKAWFQTENVTSLSAVPRGGRIHIIGVCGVAMAQLAVALDQKGFKVSGSDKEFYEPMGSLLKRSGVETKQGYVAEHVPDGVDLVVIGNAISYGNPEVDVVEQKNLPYTMFPKILREVLIGDRHSVVVTGTHGKSTTTALGASMFYKMGLKPSYFIGGVCQDLPLSLEVGDGDISVVEGDEYDSAFFAKVPKFDFYDPDTCIVNAIEYDHADIYPDLDSIVREFTDLILSMDADGVALCCSDCENVKKLVPEWKKQAKCTIYTFGTASDADFRIVERKQRGLIQEVIAHSKLRGEYSFAIPMVGAYNARNALAALTVAELRKVDFDKAREALSTYRAVKRRQELRYEGEKVILIEDFAHHPTAVLETLAAIKEAYPDRGLIAVFEPRSNTSRRKVFEKPYIKAFAPASGVVLSNVAARANDTGIELIDVPTLAEEITKSGVPAVCLATPDEVAAHLLGLKADGSVVVVMSNGAFGGLIDKLVEGYKKVGA